MLGRAVVPEWLSVHEIAETIGVAPATVRRWIVVHEAMPYAVFGAPGSRKKLVRVRREVFEKWVAAREAEARTQSEADYFKPETDR